MGRTRLWTWLTCSSARRLTSLVRGTLCRWQWELATVGFLQDLDLGAAQPSGLVGFGYDMGALAEAADGGSSSVQHALEVTDAAAEEIEKRWAEPLRRFKLWRADVRQGKRALRAYIGIMGRLLADIKARAAAGQLLESSVAGHLLRLRRPGSEGPLPDDLLLPEVAVGACRLFWHCTVQAYRASAWIWGTILIGLCLECAGLLLRRYLIDPLHPLAPSLLLWCLLSALPKMDCWMPALVQERTPPRTQVSPEPLITCC